MDKAEEEVRKAWADESGDITEAQVDYIVNGIRPPPRRLSIELHNPDYHPCFTRVGVRIDGKERNDIAYYNMDDMSYMTTDSTSHLATKLEPYWRYQPSRQQRRHEEAWERKHRNDT